MSKYCKACSGFDVCDFCKHYDFNSDEKGRYIGNGYCNFHKKQCDPGDGCNNFECTFIREYGLALKMEGE